MEIILGIIAGVVIIAVITFFIFEYRIRQPDSLVLYESKGQIRLRKGLVYPRHFSLSLKRTTNPIQLTIEATAKGNLGIRVKLVGSVAPSLEYLPSLIRVGGWNKDAVARSTDEVQVLLQELVKEYSEISEISAISTTKLLNYLNDELAAINEKYGVELISLAIQALEPTDPEITDAFRQQEQARLLEQTEQLNQLARVAAAKAKNKADDDITKMEHALELKKVQLKSQLLEKEAALSRQSLEDELARNRMRLAFEIEELEVLKNSPELLMLTPQAARLAEASQNLRNARTVISLAPQEPGRGSDLLNLFETLLQKALEGKKPTSQP
jgi:hypothetical protein